MSAFAAPISRVRRRQLAVVALLAFVACLNPQPDDGPLHHPTEPPSPGASESNSVASAPDMGTMVLEIDDGKQAPSSPASAPPPPSAPEPVPAAGTSSGADAGAPPDAGADRVAADAGVAD